MNRLKLRDPLHTQHNITDYSSDDEETGDFVESFRPLSPVREESPHSRFMKEFFMKDALDRKRNVSDNVDADVSPCSSQMLTQKSVAILDYDSEMSQNSPPDSPGSPIIVQSTQSLSQPENLTLSEQASLQDSETISEVASSAETEGGHGKKTTSDWVRNLQWKDQEEDNSPEKEEIPRSKLHDSAKKDGKSKKNKFVSGGLADRLDRLMSREKSATAFWKHKRSSGDSQEDGKVLKLSVLSVVTNYNQILAYCENVTEYRDNSFSRPLQTSKHVLAVFNLEQFPQGDALKGCKIEIHPPWQVLRLGRNEQSNSNDSHITSEVIICTQYSKIVEKGKIEADSLREIKDDGEEISNQTLTVIGRKICSCFDHGNFNKDCKEIININEDCVSGQSITGTSHHTTDPENNPGLSLITRNHSRDTLPQQGGTILSALEMGSKVISFQSVIHKIIRQISSQGKRKWSFIVQDMDGNFSEVIIMCYKLSSKFKEGQVLYFKELLVQQRLNRSTNPSLFSLIDSIWTMEMAEKLAILKKKSDSQDPVPDIPEFCYRTLAPEAEGNFHEIKSTETSGLDTLYSTPDLMGLQGIGETSHGKRISFNSTLLYFLQSNLVKETGIYYLTDESISESKSIPPYKYMFVRGSHHVPDSVKQNDVTRKLYCRDILLEQNGTYLTADSYSYVSVADSPDPPVNKKAKIEYIPNLSTIDHMGAIPELFDLVSVKGQISGVEVSTAYSWLVCPGCKSDKLAGGTSSSPELRCTNCSTTVREPETRMFLEVYIEKKIGSQSTSLKVRLLQDTIEEVLASCQEDEQGYELASVVGKMIGPITCVVCQVEGVGNNNTGHRLYLEEIHLANS